MNDIHTQLLTQVKNYKMPASAAGLLNQQPPLIISAVTASGKNTVADYIISSTDYKETISHTTRPPRPSEINGEHYWFIDEAKMLRLVQAEAFLEIKAIHGKTIYGTSVDAYKLVLNDGYKPLL